MNKRFIKKIWLIIFFTLSPYLLLFLFIGLPILLFYKQQQGEVISTYNPIGIIFLGLILLCMILCTFAEIRRLIWILKNYKLEHSVILDYLKHKDEVYQKIERIQRNTFHYRPSIKRRLYSDLLLIYEKIIKSSKM